MKTKRLPESPKSKMNLSYFQGLASHPRGVVVTHEGQKTLCEIEEKISSIQKNCFDNEDDVDFCLKDEFSVEEITEVVTGCRLRMTDDNMASEDWRKIGEYLADELWELSRLKEDLSLSERKCGMVRQKISELTQLTRNEVRKTRAMACAMLLAETEMRRDHLRTRISSIVDSFVTLILSGREESASYHEVEIRLRAVFGSL